MDLMKPHSLKSRFLNWITFSNIIEYLMLGALIYLPVSRAAADVNLYLAIIVWLIQKIKDRESPFPMTALSFFYFIFMGCLALSLVNVPRNLMAEALKGLLEWSKYILVFFLCMDLFRNPKRRKHLLFTFLLVVSVAALNGFFQLMTGHDLFRHYALEPGRIVRMSGSLKSPNTLAGFFLFAIPLALVFSQSEKHNKFKSLLFFFSFLVLCTGLIFTFSRSAFYALTFAGVFYFLKRRKPKTLLLLGSVIAVLILCFKPLYHNYVGSLNLQDITVGERLQFWKTTWEMIKLHPIIGNGVDMYSYKLLTLNTMGEAYNKYTHNCYLQLWSEIGIIGLAAFLMLFIWGFYEKFKHRLAGEEEKYFSDALEIGVLAFFAQAFFDNNFYGHETAILFWIFWGIYSGFRKASPALPENLPAGRA